MQPWRCESERIGSDDQWLQPSPTNILMRPSTCSCASWKLRTRSSSSRGTDRVPTSSPGAARDRRTEGFVLHARPGQVSWLGLSCNPLKAAYGSPSRRPADSRDDPHRTVTPDELTRCPPAVPGLFGQISRIGVADPTRVGLHGAEAVAKAVATASSRRRLASLRLALDFWIAAGPLRLRSDTDTTHYRRLTSQPFGR